jgi:hypothetical protein
MRASGRTVRPQAWARRWKTSVADVALQAAALLAVKLGSYHDFRRAPAVILALLEVAGGQAEWRDAR